MSENETEPPFILSLAKRRLQLATTGSRRKRVWDLSSHVRCPVIGVCLPMDALRRIARKISPDAELEDDYALHCAAVDACVRRTPLSEAIQQECERRYGLDIQRFAKAKSVKDVAAWWEDAADAGDVAGALWAALTHGRCDELLMDRIGRDIHMIQHQTGATKRADVQKAQALIDEHGVLSRELGKAQQRYTQLQVDRITECKRLATELIKIRTENIGKDSVIGFLRADLAELKASIPELQSRKEMAQRIKEMSARHVETRQQLDDSKQQLAQTTKLLEDARNTMQKALMANMSNHMLETSASTVPVDLGEKNVLCVGGRSGNVTLYRELIERVGGRFAHHDGGQEDAASRLDASLAAADMVICQTGCISHNAYWRVKDHCKRTGKRCIFVENPSTSSLDRALTQMSDEDKADSVQ